MPLKAISSRHGRSLRFWLFAIASAVLLLVLIAPTAIGRVVGELWVAAMSAVIGLIQALFGGA